jgi:LysM repeat protein
MMGSNGLTISDANNNYIEFQVNPSSVERKRAISYNLASPLGSVGSDARYIRHEPELLKFKTMFDGTGVLGDMVSLLIATSVKDKMSLLDKIVYNYNGDSHEPNVVTILWGSEHFEGRLHSMDRNYTLYSSEGEPLRAELDFVFVGFISAEEQASIANRSSPDLTHIIEVKAGDTLPNLCLKIYRNANYYIDIARINNLSNFRALVPGTALIFPPLKLD